MKILVCPFGDLNLLVSLGEALRESHENDGFEVTYLSFTEYDRAVYQSLGARHAHLAPGEAEQGPLSNSESDTVTEFSRKLCQLHFGDDQARSLNRRAQHYAARIDELIERERFQAVIYFNGRMNLVISALAAVAEQRGLECLVFEQGLFRPHYLTLDGKGVNFNNSVRSCEALLSETPYPFQQTPLYQAVTGMLSSASFRPIDFKRQTPKLRLALAYLKMKRLARGQIQLLSAEGRDLVEAALIKPSSSLPNLDSYEAYAANDDFDKVIVCPLQVQTDTQVLLYSPLVHDMQTLIDVVSGAVESYNEAHEAKACVLFKHHPMDPRPLHVTKDCAALIDEPRLPEIFARRCDLLLTLNSTAGIEAIEAGVPVLTLGQAFYSLPDIVAAHCTSLEDLPDLIAKALQPATKAQETLRSAFIDRLKAKYQVRRGW